MTKKAIIAGGGLGGISSAVSLRAAGYEVELYEKNPHLGGKLNLLEKEGFSFDLGPSIFTFPYIFEKLFKMHGKNMSDYLELVEPEVHWRCFFEDSEKIDLFKDLDRIRETSPSLAGEDIDDLRSFLEYSGRLFENVEKNYFDNGADNFREVFKTAGIKKTLGGFDLFSSMHKGVSSRIKNPNLVHIMDFFVKHVGSSPYGAPAVLNMIAYGQFKFGLWYVKGGMYNLARALGKLMDDTGIKVNLNTEIKKLNSDGNNISSALTDKGALVKGDIFVSNMEVIPAYAELTGEDGKFLKKYEKFEPACSGLVLHLGVRKIYPQLAHHNFFFSGNPEKHFSDVFRKKLLPEDPTIYLVAPSRTNPDVAPEGCDNIKILPHIPYIQDNPFTMEDYAELRERVLDKLERMGLEGLRENTVLEDMWTPEDIRRKYYSNRGAIYGVVSDRKKNLGFKAPKQSERYENLYFAGGSVNPGGGMPMAVLSGQQVAELVRKNHD